MNHIPRVLEQHADQALFLWFRRNRLVSSPICTLYDLTGVDERLDAHLEGLRLAGDAGWELCVKKLEHGGAGVLFSTAFMAFGCNNEERISFVLQKAGDNEELLDAVISALGWLSYDNAEPHIKKLLDESSPVLRRIGIAASAIHRVNPGRPLLDALSSDDSSLRARALKAVGELGGIDMLTQVKTAFPHEDLVCRYYAAWSAELLGDPDSTMLLKSIALIPFAYQEEAAKTAFKRMNVSAARDWHQTLANTPNTVRLATIGAGVTGDPALVPWLIEQMKAPALARIAGEAFSLITGAEIERENLKGENPGGFENGSNDNPENGKIVMDPDGDLSWPNHELISGWWENNKGRFNSGTRYLVGLPVTKENLRQVLATGSQCQRYAASVDLAMLQPGQPLFEVRAPGFRQKRLLAT